MRNKYIILITSILACIFYLIINAFPEIRQSYGVFIGSTLLFFSFLFMLGFLYLTPFKKEEKSHEIQTGISDPLNNNYPADSSQKINKSDKSSYLTHISYHDAVTKLPNYIFFNEILNKTIYYARRHSKTIALLAIELNIENKKSLPFNEEINNLILIEISKRLTKGLRAEDVLAKLDDNVFICLLSNVNKPKFASKVAEKLLAVSSHPINIEGKNYLPKVSIGIAIYPIDGTSLEKLLKNIEIALHQAKQHPEQSYCFHTTRLNTEAHQYRQLDKALHEAISNEELMLYYQPKLHIKQGSITGVEALMRWMHPTLGLIYPSQFIPLAEESGLIIKLSEWALHKACQTNKYWQNEGFAHLTIAVNISLQHFMRPNFVAHLEKILNETKLNPMYLELEIPETVLMNDIEKTAKILQDVHSLGVRLSMDHFGRGYTSISHLKKFPLSTIKIDSYFIKGIPDIPNDMTITNAFIALAHQLGFDVVAEGVETAEQVQYLASQQCDSVQGYFLCPPLPKEKVQLQFKKLMDEVIV